MSRNRAIKEFHAKEMAAKMGDTKVVKKEDKGEKEIRRSGIDRAIERMVEGKPHQSRRSSFARLEAMLIEQQDVLTAYKVTLKDYEKRLATLEAKFDSEVDDSK